MKLKSFVLIGVVILAALAAGGQAQYSSALNWKEIDIPGADSTNPASINNRREIAGDYYIGTVDHGFIMRDGVVETIDYPDTSATGWRPVTGISNDGTVVGAYQTDEPCIGCVWITNKIHGFAWKDGGLAALDVPGAGYTYPHGNNEAGFVVGEFAKDNRAYGFVATKQGITTLDVSDGPGPNAWSAAMAINPSGDIAGWYGDGNAWVFHGYVLKNGQRITVDVPGSTWTLPSGINAPGDVVGSSFDLGVGFVWSRGVMTVIRIPGASWTGCNGINDRGDIVGTYGDAEGKSHAYVVFR